MAVLDFPASPSTGDTHTQNGVTFVYDGTGWNPVTPALADSGVTTAKIAADAVTNAKIADDAVDTENLADDSVGAAALNISAGSNITFSTASDVLTINAGGGTPADGSITTAKLADDAVTAAKIADGAVGTAAIASGGVDTAELAADAVTGAKIADDAVDTEHLADDSVGAAALNISAGSNVTFSTASDVLTISASGGGGGTPGDGTITTAKLADDAVTAAKIADGAVGVSQLDVIKQFVRFHYDNATGAERKHNLLWDSSTLFTTSVRNDDTDQARMWAIDRTVSDVQAQIRNMGGYTAITAGSNPSVGSRPLDYGGLRVFTNSSWECLINGQPTVFFGAVANGATMEIALELGLQYRFKAHSATTWGSWRDCTAEDYASGGTTYYDASEFYRTSMQRDNRSGDARFRSVFRHKEGLTAQSSGTRWGDQAPAFAIMFSAGTGGAFPAAVDYHFRVVWSAGEGGTGPNNSYVRGEIERIYNYNERFTADRIS